MNCTPEKMSIMTIKEKMLDGSCKDKHFGSRQW
jgi:hypothetical protein